MHPIVLFVIIFFGTATVIGLFVATWFISKGRVKNNPENATILMKNGHEAIPIKGKRDGLPSNKGSKYNYQFNGITKFTLLPHKYTPIYVRNRVLIFLNFAGQLISSPFNSTERLSQSEREKLIYEFVEAKIGADAIREIRGKSTINVIIIGIIAFILGVGCVFGYNFISNTMKAQSKPATNTEKPAITEEYKPITEDGSN